MLAKYVERLLVTSGREPVAGGRRSVRRKRVMPFTDIENAIAAVGRGELVVVVDDADRENEGDLIMAAEKVTPETMAFMIRHTSGVICLPMRG